MSIDVVSHFRNIRLGEISLTARQLRPTITAMLLLSGAGFTHKFLRQRIDDVISKCE